MDREPPSASLIKESKSAHKREIEDNLLEVEECLNAKVKVLGDRGWKNRRQKSTVIVGLKIKRYILMIISKGGTVSTVV